MRTSNLTKVTGLFTVVLIALSFSNCSVRVEPRPRAVVVKQKPLPPGQAKKVYGEQSARNFAPGHNKRG